MRRAFILKGTQWKEVKFSQLRKGDIFKLYEADLTPVLMENGEENFIAKGNPYMNGQVLQIDCDGFFLSYLSDVEQAVVDKAIEDQKKVIARIAEADAKKAAEAEV